MGIQLYQNPQGALPVAGGSTVTATGATTARPLADRSADAVNVKDFGATSGGSAGSLLTTFQAAINALPAIGGSITVPAGDYSNLVATSLTFGTKAVTWNAFGATLPASMPGCTIRAGIFSLPESSIQANRNVRIHNNWTMDPIETISGTRQYAHHVSGFLSHLSGSPTEVETRAFSFDLGTNQNDVVDAVRGVKGRVYATGGKANIRAIYGFAESTSGGSHTGELTGLLGTIYRNSNLNTDGDAYAVRGHVDNGCTGSFQAAAGVSGAVASFGFACRTGTGGPFMASVACFQAHGGGAGDMYMGYTSNTDLTKIFQVTNAAHVKAVSYYSNTVSIADGAVATLTPPATTGFCKVWFDGGGTYGEVFYRTSAALCTKNYGAATFIATTGDLTGTTGVAGNITVSMGTTGLLNIENRTGATRNINYFFVAK